MNLKNKKFKIVKDNNGNEMKVYKLTQKELKEYLKKFNRGIDNNDKSN